MNVKTYWDWSKLTKDLKKEVRDCYYLGKIDRIMEIHNQNKMSVEWYCCETQAVKNHVSDAIEKEII